MELIAALAEAHKCQEATLEDMKKKLEENQMKVDKVVQERLNMATELEQCNLVIKDLECDKEILQKELEDLITSSQSEINKLKNTIENKQNDWNKLLNKHKQEINIAEMKLTDTEVELSEALNKIEKFYKKETVINREFKKLKTTYCLIKEENNKMKHLNESLEKNLQEAKMDLLKMSNNNDRLADEIKWAAKQIATYKDLLDNVKQEKELTEKRNQEYLTSLEKNRSLEKEFRDLKLNVVNLTKHNRTILESICGIKTALEKDTKNVFIQTEMSGKDLSEYEHLDREATLLVIRLREELVSAKDELIRMKQENEQMKSYMCDTRRQIEIADEEQRIQRLERTVNSLTELVNKDVQSSARYPTGANICTPTSIMAALEDVKKDLAVLKTRDWHRVIRADVEMPTRDRNSPSSRFNAPNCLRSVQFNERTLSEN